MNPSDEAPTTPKGYTAIRVVFRVKAGATPEKLMACAVFSPVYETVSRSVPVDIRIEKARAPFFTRPTCSRRPRRVMESPVMDTSTQYTPTERLALLAVAAFGLIVVNGLFVYAVINEPDGMRRVLTDPLLAGFVLEAFTLLGVLAWLLPRARISRVGAGSFIAAAVLGSLAFALPVALLLAPRDRR